MRQQLPNSLSRDDTLSLKGFAILLMIMHHVLIGSFYDSPDPILSNEGIVRLSIVGKLCVGIYTFIIGYGYAFAVERNWSYSLRHIIRLLVRYWFLCIVFIFIGILNGFQPDWYVVLLNLFGLKCNYNLASWFVYFYIFSMLTLPIISRLLDKFPVTSLISIIVVSAVGCHFTPESNVVTSMMKNCFMYSPVLFMGYFVAKYDWSFIKHKFSTVELVLITLLMLAACGVSRVFMGFCTYTFIAPIFAVSLVMLLNYPENRLLKRVLMNLGKASMYMWFIHAVFFSSKTRSIFQQSDFWPNNLFVLFLLVVIISYVLALLLLRLDAMIIRKNKS